MKVIKIHQCSQYPYFKSRVSMTKPTINIYYCGHRNNNGQHVELTVISPTCPLDEKYDSSQPKVLNSEAYLVNKIKELEAEDIRFKAELKASIILDNAHNPIKELYPTFTPTEHAILDKGTSIEIMVTVHSQTSRNTMCSISCNGHDKYDVMTKRLTKL